MNRQQVEELILERLKARGNGVVNRNALQALFGAFGAPGDALGRIFLGRNDALEAEQSRIMQEIILDLVCKIDDALTEARTLAREKGVEWTVIDGTIEAQGTNVDDVTGAHIETDAGPVELKPGTHIRATGSGAKQVTGLKVGGKGKREEKA